MKHPLIDQFERYQQDFSRRTFLKRSFAGIGGMALSQLLGAGSSSSLPFLQSQGGLHFPARAKRIVHLCMAGGPSHLESFDPKPQLDALHGKPFPASFTAGQQLAQLQGSQLIARGSFTKFKKWGESGIEISELFPHIGSIADEICVVRSMVTEQINHDPAHAFMNSGSILKGRPSMGSWLLYGLGAESQNLPGYVVMVSRGEGADQPISARQWSSGFLPSKFQGVQFQSKGSAVHYVGNPDGVCQSTQRQVIEEIAEFGQGAGYQIAPGESYPEAQARVMAEGRKAVAFAAGFAAQMVRLPPLIGFLAAGFVLNAMGFERSVALDTKQLREQARAALRERKYEPAYNEWVREVRDRAYVEFREAPL